MRLVPVLRPAQSSSHNGAPAGRVLDSDRPRGRDAPPRGVGGACGSPSRRWWNAGRSKRHAWTAPMTCNAWNHPPGCDCGWGGDTGGGGFVWRSSWKAKDRPEDYGHTWGISSRAAGYESFTRPNAKCPVCGARVFFYQSSNGGRVFFESLGPPWEKHPCTDRAPDSAGYPERAVVDEHSPIRDGFKLGGWIPAYAARWAAPQGVDKGKLHVELDLKTGRDGHATRVTVPIGSRIDLHSPIFVRPHSTRPDWCWIEGPGVWSPDGAPSPILALGGDATGKLDNELAELALEASYSEVLVALGRSVSFDVENEPWRIDYHRARRWFESAARLGNWKAFNNLALMFEGGLGGKKDPTRAFAYFRRATRSGSAVALGNLARCYRDGIGVQSNPALADFYAGVARYRARCGTINKRRSVLRRETG